MVVFVWPTHGAVSCEKGSRSVYAGLLWHTTKEREIERVCGNCGILLSEIQGGLGVLPWCGLGLKS